VKRARRLSIMHWINAVVFIFLTLAGCVALVLGRPAEAAAFLATSAASGAAFVIFASYRVREKHGVENLGYQVASATAVANTTRSLLEKVSRAAVSAVVGPVHLSSTALGFVAETDPRAGSQRRIVLVTHQGTPEITFTISCGFSRPALLRIGANRSPIEHIMQEIAGHLSTVEAQHGDS
jgi:hypothetical protein